MANVENKAEALWEEEYEEAVEGGGDGEEEKDI